MGFPTNSRYIAEFGKYMFQSLVGIYGLSDTGGNCRYYLFGVSIPGRDLWVFRHKAGKFVSILSSFNPW